MCVCVCVCACVYACVRVYVPHHYTYNRMVKKKYLLFSFNACFLYEWKFFPYPFWPVFATWCPWLSYKISRIQVHDAWLKYVLWYGKLHVTELTWKSTAGRSRRASTRRAMSYTHTPTYVYARTAFPDTVFRCAPSPKGFPLRTARPGEDTMQQL